jgi:hypothetical protein
MPRYITLHSLACLTRQGAEELTSRLHAAKGIQTRRVLVNLVEGKMLAEVEAADRDTVLRCLAEENCHYDWVVRVEFESSNGRLVAV